MSEEDLELLITLDDPGEDAQDEANLNHFEADNTVAHRPGPPYSPRRRPGQRTEVNIDHDCSKLAGF